MTTRCGGESYSQGVPGDEQRTPHGMDSQLTYRIVLKAGADRVTVLTLNGKVLDDVKRPDPAAAQGKIGFRGDVSLVATQTGSQ